MPGTRDGARKAQETIRKLYGVDPDTNKSVMMETIGRMGGKISRGGGFASEFVGADGLTGRERAQIAGEKGGKASRRGKAKHHESN